MSNSREPAPVPLPLVLRTLKALRNILAIKRDTGKEDLAKRRAEWEACQAEVKKITREQGVEP
jgi:hypothetical protein